MGFCDWATVLVSIWGAMFRKTGFVFIKTFPFLLVWVLALLVSELDFWWWPPSSLIEILYSFVKDSFHFLRNCFFPELLHTLGLHKFVGSISGVVSMNTACILKMILEWIHLGRPMCHRCKNFKALCRYTLFTVRMSRMLSRWRVLSVCLCNVPITVAKHPHVCSQVIDQPYQSCWYGTYMVQIWEWYGTTYG